MPPTTRSHNAATFAPSTTKEGLPRSKGKEPFKSSKTDDAEVTTIPPAQPSPDVSPITIMLSQYAILEQLCHSLPSADLVHLAATSKENRRYITESSVLYEKFRKSCPCDGKGIGSRARYFGHWNAKPEDATVSCKEHKAKACTRCTAKVCEACRFQFFYFDLRQSYMCKACDTVHGPLSDDDQFVGEIDDEYEWLEYLTDIFGWTLSKVPDKINPSYGMPLSTIKALQLLGKARERRFCARCRPQGLSTRDLYQWAEENSGFDVDGDDYFDAFEPVWCHCGPWELDQKYPWLCIPCFIDLELEALKSLHQHRCTVFYGTKQRLSDGADVRGIVGREVEYVCDCGKPAVPNDFVKCRLCSNIVRPDNYDYVSEEE